MDDTCCALPEADLPRFLHHLNSIEPSIQFTCEREVEGVLPFLDIRLQRNSDGSVSTSVYRKPTHTDRYLDFCSHHPLQHKVSVVRTLVSRANRLCSSVASGSVELAHISKALMTNGYPTSFISRHSTLPTRPHRRPPPQHPVPLLHPRLLWFSLMWKGHWKPSSGSCRLWGLQHVSSLSCHYSNYFHGPKIEWTTWRG